MKRMVCAMLVVLLMMAAAHPAWAEETRLLPETNPQATEETEPEQPAKELMPEEELLNTITELAPISPESDQLAELVEQVVDEVTDESMTTGEQVRACYDYLVDNTSYGSHMAYLSTPVGDTTCRQVYATYGEIEGFGAVALTAHKGMCNAYASAFIMMVRSIGLEARLARGYTISRGGSFAYHEWAEVLIDGQPYVFDPQLEQDLVESGLAPYAVFGKTYAQVGNRYSLL